MTADVLSEATIIHAPIARCFALSTRVELVERTLGMKPVGGVTSGHVTAGSRVHWRGWKFGLPTQHHTLITGYEEPRPAQTAGDLDAEAPGRAVAWFQDTQERGRFASFHHDHFFRESTAPGGTPLTVLEDEVHFTLPFGALGSFVARHIIAPYIRRLARQRFAMIKSLAEGEGWKEWVAS